MEFGKYLRRLRLDKELTLVEVYKASGISISYLSEIEQGKRTSPHPNLLKKLAEVYGVTAQELMEAAGYITKDEKPRVFSKKDEIEWAISTVLRDPTYGPFYDKVKVKSMTLEKKIILIKSYEVMTGKKLLQ